MTRQAYEIKFRASRGGPVQIWTRFAEDDADAFFSAAHALAEEYGGAAVIESIARVANPGIIDPKASQH